jgi:hypothetical protein
MRTEDRIPVDEWELFVRGPSDLPEAQDLTRPDESVPMLTWRRFLAMVTRVKSLASLESDIQCGFAAFRGLSVGEFPHQIAGLTPFQRLLALSVACARKFILAVEGDQFAVPPTSRCRPRSRTRSLRSRSSSSSRMARADGRRAHGTSPRPGKN